MPFEPTAEEIADRYAEARSRVTALAQTLTADQAGRPVPGTPKWNATELMCHVVGSGIALANGEFDGAGGPEWTQAQVEARRGRSVADLLEEWDQESGRVDALIRAGSIPSPVTFDVVTHEQDIRGAVGASPLDDPLAIGFVLEGFAARAVGVAAKKGLPALVLIDEDSGWSFGETGGSSLSGSRFELFRALTGRRSGAQVSAMAWSGDPAPYLDLLCPFGPLRDTDVHD